MNIVVPFATNATMLSAVRLALSQDGLDASFRHCDKDTSYHDLLLEYWSAKEDFCVIEHDIVVWPGALGELEQCNELWCTRPYYCSVGWIVDGLGCTKFSKKLIEMYPNFLSEPFPTCCQHTRYFCGLDRLIAHRAQELGIKPHVHLPGVSNLNEKWT
jgi:hypothetical protein